MFRCILYQPAILALLVGGCAVQGERVERSPVEPSTLEQEQQLSAELAVERQALQTEVAKSRPTGLSERMPPGRCMSQADCGPGLVCVARRPGMADCEDATLLQIKRPLRAAPNGRPAPPVGLLDGQVLRDHVRQARP